MARTDIHRPSVLKVEDYDFVKFDYLPNEDDVLGTAMFLADERARFVAHMNETGARYGENHSAGNCYICGAHNIYSATFWHKPSNSYIHTGLDCASNLECGDVDAFRKNVSNALEAGAGKRKAKAILEEAGAGKAWEFYVAKADGRDESTVADIVSRLVKWGDISDKAMAFLKTLLDRIERAPEIAAERAAEAAAAKPVPEFTGRVLIEGEVLFVRKEDGVFGYAEKALVRHSDGWKIFGNLPSSLHGLVERGDRLKLVATVTISDNDPKFAFWKRPAKAEVIKVEVAA